MSHPVFPKWIIEKNQDGSLCFNYGRVTLHKDLQMTKEDVLGGGYWIWDRYNDGIFLFGKSEDFGPATYEDVRNAITNETWPSRWEDTKYKFYFTDKYQSYSNLTDKQIKEIQWVPIIR